MGGGEPDGVATWDTMERLGSTEYINYVVLCQRIERKQPQL